MSVFIGSTTTAQRNCLSKEFKKLYAKKTFIPRKQKIAIALNTCNVGIKGVKKDVDLIIDKKYQAVMNDADFYPFLIVDDKGNVVGSINVNYRNDLNAFQISNSKVVDKGKGIGKKAYLLLIKKLKKPLYSDSSLTQDAENLWRSLVRSGYAKFDESKGKFVSKK